MRWYLIIRDHGSNSTTGMPRAGLKAYFVAVCFMFLLCLPLVSQADSTRNVLEYKVKAAYLYNFTKFVNWPSQVLTKDTEVPLKICILGVDPFGHSIDLLSNKTAKGRRVVIRYIQELDDNPVDCQVMFISRSESANIDAILQMLADQHVLTVSDIEGFAMKGGCIRLNVIEGKVRFNINIQATRRAGLDMSAKLLELARVVIE
jgi:hypothetical protein